MSPGGSLTDSNQVDAADWNSFVAAVVKAVPQILEPVGFVAQIGVRTESASIPQ
ncbi:hypothetical protein [Azospirillum griseum]|uniref:hypothetical protein n=1 Tax=Azospirillum griseum TaxID=2496639 RepID=UPI001AECA6A5|nr:hypothetical protein [Azospirillum griseum]